MSWIAEAQEPDGSWRQVAGGADVRQVIRQLRRWRRDRAHLAADVETRVRRG